MQSFSKVFKALSSEQRLKIIDHLLEVGEYKCYCELGEVVDKDMSVIYRHFKALQDAGVIETRKRGKRLEGRIKNQDKIRELIKIAKEVNNES